jgi:hypothetical protein
MSDLHLRHRRGESTSPSSELTWSQYSAITDCPTCELQMYARFSAAGISILNLDDIIARLCDEHSRMLRGTVLSPETSQPSPSHPE